MKLLVVTNLFPNAEEPNRSAANFQQFSALSRLCELKVVAPIPFFQYSRAQVPASEKIAGIDVFHPRYLVIPKVLRWTQGVTFFLGIRHTVTSVGRSFRYDAILATWAYPDAVGAAIAARLLRKKLFIKVHGTDINLAYRHWGRVRMIRWALTQAEKVIAVSQPLEEQVVAMGIPEEKVIVIPNGVDQEKFFPRDKVECRKKLGLEEDKKLIVYIGNLVEVKGVEFLIRAFQILKTGSASAGVSQLELVIVGDGMLKDNLENLAEMLGVGDQVHFKGRQSHEMIPIWLNAANVFCLPSLNEGCPNVVLEAMACGIRVVASKTGGIPDIIDSPDKGWLANPEDPESLAENLAAALDDKATHAAVGTISWEENARELDRKLE